MSLVIKIQINNKILSIVTAQRIAENVIPGVNRYKICSIDYREDPDGEEKVYGTILHTYADSAEVLTMKALKKVMEE